MTDSRKVAEAALELYEKINPNFGVFEKQDIVAILGTMIELDVRRHVRVTQQLKTK